MRRRMPARVLRMAISLMLFGVSIGGAWAQRTGAVTPSELVSAYDTLADTILAVKKTEWHMVQSILATTYNHAEATFRAMTRKMETGQDAQADVEKLADLVAQLGNEGDAAVAAIRKRLVEGGHHHNVKEEQQGIYDEGFVIVTRKAKKVFLDAAGNIGRQSTSPDQSTLEREWRTVADQYQALWEGS